MIKRPAVAGAGEFTQARQVAAAAIQLEGPTRIPVLVADGQRLHPKLHKSRIAPRVHGTAGCDHAVREVRGAGFEFQAVGVAAAVVGAASLLKRTPSHGPGVEAVAARPRLAAVGGHRFQEHRVGLAGAAADAGAVGQGDIRHGKVVRDVRRDPGGVVGGRRRGHKRHAGNDRGQIGRGPAAGHALDPHPNGVE